MKMSSPIESKNKSKQHNERNLQVQEKEARRIVEEKAILKLMKAPRIYDHGDFLAYWDPKTGLFARGDLANGVRPEWSPMGPDLADIHITDYCPMTCDYCYRESDPSKSTHMTVVDFRNILMAMRRTVNQIAIGGGSPQHHPQFIEILETAHHMGIVPSYTTNGLDMTDEILEASKKFCGAVAVSMHNFEFAIKTVKRMIAYGVPTAIHVILSRDKIDSWKNQVRLGSDGVGVLGGEIPLYSCIFLMHKPIGRGNWDQHPTVEQKLEFMKTLQEYRGPIALGVDSCSSSSLISKSHLDKLPVINLGPCDSACFSVFVDEHLQVSPCSFNKTDLFSLEEFSFEEIWKEKFQPYRERVLNTCPDCESRVICRSCQVIPQINPCNKPTRTV
jgi:MoaA/NifB/PqqE/SkfB family radical SAM enzyme